MLPDAWPWLNPLLLRRHVGGNWVDSEVKTSSPNLSKRHVSWREKKRKKTKKQDIGGRLVFFFFLLHEIKARARCPRCTKGIQRQKRHGPSGGRSRFLQQRFEVVKPRAARGPSGAAASDPPRALRGAVPLRSITNGSTGVNLCPPVMSVITQPSLSFACV